MWFFYICFWSFGNWSRPQKNTFSIFISSVTLIIASWLNKISWFPITLAIKLFSVPVVLCHPRRCSWLMMKCILRVKSSTTCMLLPNIEYAIFQKFEKVIETLKKLWFKKLCHSINYMPTVYNWPSSVIPKFAPWH